MMTDSTRAASIVPTGRDVAHLDGAGSIARLAGFFTPDIAAAGSAFRTVGQARAGRRAPAGLRRDGYFSDSNLGPAVPKCRLHPARKPARSGSPARAPIEPAASKPMTNATSTH